jgi:hypothetical protein
MELDNSPILPQLDLDNAAAAGEDSEGAAGAGEVSMLRLANDLATMPLEAPPSNTV